VAAAAVLSINEKVAIPVPITDVSTRKYTFNYGRTVTVVSRRSVFV